MIANVQKTIKPEVTVTSEWSNYFDRIVLINLARRKDRLDLVRNEIEKKGWCFKDIEVFSAIDGNKVPVPYGWEQGGGAWGCMESHRQILERAIMDDVESLLVLEDDLVLAEDFVPKVNKFLSQVPQDWEQLMIGGQHHNTPILISDGVLKCTNCQRTHAYAIRGNFLRELYATWCSPNVKVHCDWVMGPLQAYFKVYAPDPFLIGQGSSYSDICGRINPVNFWIPPSGKEHLILLKCDKELLPELRKKGIHTGFNRNSEDVDVGVEEAYSLEDVSIERLSKWAADVVWEVKSDNNLLVAACWHPKATLNHLKSCWKGPAHEINGSDVDEIVYKARSVMSKLFV